MAQRYIAAALAGVEADSRDEAWEYAQYNELPWEVTGVTEPERLEVVLAPHRGINEVDLLPRRQKWPLFGRFSLVGVPLLAYGAIADTSAIRALAVAVLG